MIEGSAFYIGGGARHDPSLVRQVAYKASQGNTGIDFPTDFAVTALTTPGTKVRIAPGSGSIKSRYPTAFAESYLIRAKTETLVDAPANNGSTPLIRWLILRVDDPQFPGVVAPVSVAYGPYVKPVWVDTDPGWMGKNLPYPAMPLARLTLPANTSTVLNSYLVGTRKMATPQRDGDKVLIFPTSDLTIPTAAYGPWPIRDNQRPSVYVPEWATRLDVSVDMSGVKFTEPAGIDSNPTVAGIRSVIGGTNYSENGIIIEDTPGRGHYKLLGSHAIPESMRGTQQLLGLQGFRTSNVGVWTADYQSGVGIDYVFSDRPV